jgi:pimeloyl-ACP methyl ester carboxylesterase
LYKIKLWGILAVPVFLLLFIFGWRLLRPPSEHQATVPAGARAGDLILHPCPVKIDGTEYRADCGVFVVPEIRDNPDTRLIALPVKRIHSADQNPAEPVFYLAGGPGQSNMSFAIPSWLLAEHDFVQIGYRGVDGTPKLDCPEFSDAAKGKDGDLLGGESLDNMGAAIQACAGRLQAAGVNLAGYSIPETVRDMEAARSALGYALIDLLSESYGTRVAQIFADLYPESLRRSAMIGVNPPGHMFWNPETVDDQLAYYEGLWRQAASMDAPDLVAAMRDVNADMPTRWLFLPIDPGKVKIVAFELLFNRTTAPMVFNAYLAARQGDPSGLAMMSLMYDFVVPNSMTWGHLFAMGASDYEPGRDYRAELMKSGFVLGSPMSLMIFGSAAENWPVVPLGDDYRKARPVDVETLLVGGTVDFSTPVQFATDELLPLLGHGQQVVIAEQGHTQDFWAFRPEARQRLLTSFYDTEKADASLYITLPMDFKPSVGFPILAKILAAVISTVVLALAGLAWIIMRRIRRTTVEGVKTKRP